MSLNPVILYRNSRGFEDELEIAKKYFSVYERRSRIPANSLVIPRYSALPFYKELQDDVEHNNSKLINTYRQHLYAAKLDYWYPDLEEITPYTWFRLQDIPEEGPFVLKGSTNSKKFSWRTHMFAENKKEAIEVHSRLEEDGLIGEQSIYIRKYIPLHKLAEAPQDLPISEEYRFFILDQEVLSGAFYWSSYTDELDRQYSPDNVPQEFLDNVIEAVGDKIRFYVVDVARTSENTWIVIELNDGQMSGLSDINPHHLYYNLRRRL